MSQVTRLHVYKVQRTTYKLPVRSESQAVSMLGLRPLYFTLAAVAAYVDSMQQALGAVLVLISLKIFGEAAGLPIPLYLFVGILIAWRILAAAAMLWRRSRKMAHAKAQRMALMDGMTVVDGMDDEVYSPH